VQRLVDDQIAGRKLFARVYDHVASVAVETRPTDQ
jgi:hypothetical protein